MAIKILGGVVALSLVMAYLLPPLVKLKDFALGTVIVIGIVMMLIDLWQTLRSEKD